MTSPSAESASPSLSAAAILESLSSITLQIQHGEDWATILQQAIATARTLLHTDRILICRFCPDANAVEVFESVGAGWIPIAGQLMGDPNLQDTWRECYRREQVTSIADIDTSHLPTCHVELLARFQVQAQLVVPVFSRGHLWGSLVVHHCCAPRSWHAIDVQYLQQVAFQLGIAIALEPEQQALPPLFEQFPPTARLRCDEQLVAGTSDCVALIDHNYIYQVVNQTYLNWHQKLNHEVVGHAVWELLGQDFFETWVKSRLDRCLAGDPQHVLETWQNYANGRRRYIHATYTPYREPSGCIAGVVVNVHDLTELKQAEAALQESEDRFRMMSNSAPVLMWMSGVDGCCDFFNEGWLRFTGHTLAQELGNGWIEGVHSDDLDHCLSIYQSAFQARQPFTMEYRLRRADGAYRWILDQGTPRFTSQGDFAGFIGCCIDVSDRKAVEEALRQSETTNRAMLSAIPDLLLRIKRDGTCLDFIPPSAAEAGLFIPFEHHIAEILPPNLVQHQLERIEQALATGQLQIWEHQIWKEDRLCDEELRLIPCGVDEVLIVVRDITKRKQLEKKLWLADCALEHLAVSATWIDRQARIRRVNATICAALGYSRDELEAMSFEQIDPNFPRAGWEQFWDILVQQQNMTFCSHQRTKSGELLPVEVTVRYMEFDGEAYSFAIAKDIRERLQTEQQLHLQSAALDACADIIVITDQRGIIEWANPAFTEVTGYALSEAIGKNPNELVKSGLHDRTFYRNLWSTILSGQTWRGEITNRRKDYSLYIEDVTITPVRDRQNCISHFIAIKQDITERKRLEQFEYQRVEQERVINQISQHIRQSLNLDQILNTAVAEVRQFLQTDRVIIYRLNQDWTGVVVAESIASGWRPMLNLEVPCSFLIDMAETLGYENCPPGMAETNTVEYAHWHRQLLKNLQVRAKLVVPILHRNQIWGWLITHQCASAREWQPFEMELMTQLTTRMAIAIQQSELYQQVQTLNTELELQVQERTAQLQQALDFESLLKRITDRVRDSLDESQILQTVVQELATELNIECCDAGLYDLHARTSTISYECLRSAVPPAKGLVFSMDASADIHDQLLQGLCMQFCLTPLWSNSYRNAMHHHTAILSCPFQDEQGVIGDLWLFKPKHEYFSEIEIRLVQQVANQCAIALRQSRLYQAAQTQVQELERLHQLKDDFLSTVSHELRTPMSNIKMATQMLEISLNRLGVLQDESNLVKRYFNVLREEGQREISLINDLLDLARLDAGTEPLAFVDIELQYYIPHLAEVFTERMRQQQQSFRLDIPADLPPITTDLPYLERILTELLQNACKYTPATETISVSASITATGVEICVRNTGVEISPIERDRIFDKFYRIPKNDPWKYGGTGLGLALVKKLVERLGGNIRLDSDCRQTTFIVELPIA